MSPVADKVDRIHELQDSAREDGGPGMEVDDFFKSVNRLSWTISLLIFQQLGNTMSLLSRQNDNRNWSIGTGNAHLVQDAMTWRPGSFSNPADFCGLFKMGIQALHQSAGLVKTLSSAPENRVEWQELQNKLESFSFFEQVDLEFNISKSGPLPLAELVARAKQLESYRSVWLMEGLGHYYSDFCLRHREMPSLSSLGLPIASLVPMHAGMGLSLAEWLLPSIEQNPSSVQIFLETCRSCSHPGYFGVSCEALGLATRNLYPHLLLPIDEAISAIDEEVIAYFWHGVGRAIYFSPSNFFPWQAAPWQGLRSCFTEPPHAIGRNNALSGFCWALTLVNICHPEIIETFLRHHAGELTQNDAAAEGIGSALVVWIDATSSPQCLDSLRFHHAAPSISAIWQKYVQENCEKALERHQKAQSAMGELFRCQSIRGPIEPLATPQNMPVGTTFDAVISRIVHGVLRPQPVKWQDEKET